MAGPILTIEVPVGAGRVLSVSAFDAVVLLTFVILCRPYRPSSLRGIATGLWPLGLFAALAVAYTGASLVFGHDLQLPGLLRESVKYVGFSANLAMLIMIFRTAPLDSAPSRGTLAATAIAIGGGSIAYALTPAFFSGGSYITVIGAVLTTITFLLTAQAKEPDNRRVAVLTWAALGIAFAAVWIMWSKFFLLCIAGCVLVALARAGLRRLNFNGSHVWSVVLGTLCLIGLMLGLWLWQGWRFKISYDARLDLWRIAAGLISHSFPWGIGLGQFGAHLAHIAGYEREGQLRFVHNQFLAFITEAGATGIVFGLIVIKLVVDASRAWRDIMVVIFFCILLGAMTIDDGIGLRALQLLLGYSLAVAVRPGAGGFQRRRLA